jgi:hypothetical protein
MAELVTEAKSEVWCQSFGEWFDLDGPDAHDEPRTIPHAVEEGRAFRARELQRGVTPLPRPVRVIDSAGVVVAQWGRP